jgi:hypothetical protein
MKTFLPKKLLCELNGKVKKEGTNEKTTSHTNWCAAHQ